MALIIRFYGVVIPIANIEKCKDVGGLRGILEKEKTWVGKRILYDDYLYKDGAMGPDDVEAIANYWQEQGLIMTEYINGKRYWKDMCVVDCLGGPTLPCDWLEYEQYDRTGVLVWMKGKPRGRVIKAGEVLNPLV